MLNAILESVENYCFSSLNVQICDILFAVVVMVTLSFCYRFVKLSFPLITRSCCPSKNMRSYTVFG